MDSDRLPRVMLRYEVQWPYKRMTTFQQSTAMYWWEDGTDDVIEMFYSPMNVPKCQRGVVSFDTVFEAELWAQKFFKDILDKESWSNLSFCSLVRNQVQAKCNQGPAQDTTKQCPAQDATKAELLLS